MSSTKAQLITARASAGAAYASAAQAFVDAYVTLAAYDAVLQGSRLQVDGGGFHAMPTVLAHPDFLSQAARDAMVSPNTVSPAVQGQAATLMASWSGS